MDGLPASDHQLHLTMQDTTVAETAAALFEALAHPPWPAAT
jgi:hypothetical protein